MQTDVVVIGGGGSGLAAAIAAAAGGADVVLLEKNVKLGGTTGWSIGIISATRTVNQRRLGITDSPDEHSQDLILALVLQSPLGSTPGVVFAPFAARLLIPGLVRW